MIEELIEEQDELTIRIMELEKDQRLFEEGDYLENLYVLLEGEVQLIKRDLIDGETVSLATDRLKPGSFIGLIAFTTGNPSMTTARVLRQGRAFRIKQQEFDELLHRHHRLSYPMQQLMIANLVERYQQNGALQLKLEKLNQELKEEQDELKKAYEDLENTQNLLIHKEKMATLGQLVAGFAHEINNPVSALIRSSESLAEQLSLLLNSEKRKTDLNIQVYKAGLESNPMNTTEQRKRINELKKIYPDLARTKLRKLAQMPTELEERIREESLTERLDSLLGHFESGKLLHNIQHASRRIGNLVKSLKNYSRQDSNTYELLDIREGIHDTLQMLSNRLKFHEVELNLADIPETCVNAAELNQVWTNLIINACDAMEQSGKLTIESLAENDKIIIKVSDTGPGVPREIRQHIFEPNFTTKNKSKKFGLGLGLAISSEIIQKHDGEITVGDAPDGGAQFTVELPVDERCD